MPTETYIVAGAHRDITFLLQRHYARDYAHVTVGGIWCVEEVGDHHGQETGIKCDFDSSRKKWTFSSGPLLCQRFRRRPEETACKRRRKEISLVFVIVMYMCRRRLFLINCFGIEIVLCDLHLKRFDFTKGLLFDTFVITIWYKLCCCDHSIFVP